MLELDVTRVSKAANHVHVRGTRLMTDQSDEPLFNTRVTVRKCVRIVVYFHVYRYVETTALMQNSYIHIQTERFPDVCFYSHRAFLNYLPCRFQSAHTPDESVEIISGSVRFDGGYG